MGSMALIVKGRAPRTDHPQDFSTSAFASRTGRIGYHCSNFLGFQSSWGPILEEPSALEQISSSTLVGAGAALISAAQPWAAALPTLVNSLAAGRMQKRIEQAIRAVETDLSRLNTQVEAMSDAQYKLVAEVVHAMFRTNDEEKLIFLRHAAVNGVLDVGMGMDRAYALARIVRDISAPELRFILHYQQYKLICRRPTEFVAGEEFTRMRDQGWLVLENDVTSETAFSGLLSLGLVAAKKDMYNDLYELTPLALSLIALVRPSDREV